MAAAGAARRAAIQREVNIRGFLERSRAAGREPDEQEIRERWDTGGGDPSTTVRVRVGGQ